MKRLILLFSLLFILTNLTGQIQFPKYSIGTDISAFAEFRRTVWLNQQFRITPSDEAEQPLKYKSIILDAGYIVGQIGAYDESLDENKISFKLRTGINFHKKKKDNFYIYQGLLLGMKSVQFSKFGDVVIPKESDSTSTAGSWGVGLLLSAISPPTTTVEMLREGYMYQYSLQYTLGFEWFLDKRISIQNSYHLGVKYKSFKITRGQEDFLTLVTVTDRYYDDFKNESYTGVDFDIALKINFYLF